MCRQARLLAQSKKKLWPGDHCLDHSDDGSENGLKLLGVGRNGIALQHLDHSLIDLGQMAFVGRGL